MDQHLPAGFLMLCAVGIWLLRPGQLLHQGACWRARHDTTRTPHICPLPHESTSRSSLFPLCQAHFGLPWGTMGDHPTGNAVSLCPLWDTPPSSRGLSACQEQDRPLAGGTGGETMGGLWTTLPSAPAGRLQTAGRTAGPVSLLSLKKAMHSST